MERVKSSPLSGGDGTERNFFRRGTGVERRRIYAGGMTSGGFFVLFRKFTKSLLTFPLLEGVP